MYGIYAIIWGLLMVNVTIYGIHGSYGNGIIIGLYALRSGKHTKNYGKSQFWMGKSTK